MNALTDFFDVVAHIVETHPTWNLGMSKTEARTKVAAARAEEIARTIAPVAHDGADVISAVGAADVTGPMPSIEAAEKLIADGQAMLDALKAGTAEEVAK